MKIICIGRNYANHAAELGNQVPERAVVFLKPQSAILSHKHPFYIPSWTQDVHHEVELVVKINRLGKTISEAHAPGITAKSDWVWTSPHATSSPS